MQQVKETDTGYTLAIDSIGHDLDKTVFGWDKYSNWKYAEAFVYCFRRFGAPKYGSDDYKELCTYLLTCPTKGFSLSIRFASYGFVSFALYSKDETLQQRLFDESRQDFFAWYEGLGKWATEHHPEFLDIWREPNTKVNERFKVWLTATYPDYESFPDSRGQEIFSEFYKIVDKRNAEITALYPVPRPEKETSPQPLRAEILSVMEKAMRELLCPVHIRDTYCNINGNVPDADLKGKKTRKPYRFSGYGYVSGGEMKSEEPNHGTD